MDDKDELLRFLTELSSVQDLLKISFYFVGGCVRDALFGVSSDDFDIAVDGDIQTVIDYFKSRYSMKPSQFGTTSIAFGKAHVDFAEMRQEHYPDFSGLPVISEGTLETDLKRRDFTINTGYVKFSEKAIDSIVIQNKLQCALVDLAHPYFFEDIELKKLRVLHSNAFREDATRMLRAVKYQVMHDLTFEKGTKAQFDKGIKEGWHNDCSENRYKKILIGYAAHQKWNEILRKIYEWGLFQRKDATSVSNIDSWFKQFEVLENKIGHFDKGTVFLLLMYATQLSYWNGASRSISAQVKTCQTIIDEWARGLSSETLYNQLSLASNEVLAFFCMRDHGEVEIKRLVEKYVGGAGEIQLFINGLDLIELGLNEGLSLGRVLKDLLKYEREHLKNLSKREELEWVERRIHEYRD
ncbi:MAG TPA: hypothetical protein DCS67_11625 [Clostridiales bacterium UBA8960]|nr:hypothetical protein [Clostridiales bacterium UBA8960]